MNDLSPAFLEPPHEATHWAFVILVYLIVVGAIWLFIANFLDKLESFERAAKWLSGRVERAYKLDDDINPFVRDLMVVIVAAIITAGILFLGGLWPRR